MRKLHIFFFFGLIIAVPSIGESYCFYNGFSYQCTADSTPTEQIYADMRNGDQSTYNYTYTEKQDRQAADAVQDDQIAKQDAQIAEQDTQIQYLDSRAADFNKRLDHLEKPQYIFETAVRFLRTKRIGTEAVAAYNFNRQRVSSAGVRLTIDLTR